MNRKLCLCLVALFPAFFGLAATADEPSLRDTVLALDKQLFDAFNERDVDTFKRMFDEDIEFFHDIGGLSDYDQAITNTAQLFERDTGLTRELLLDSVSVYPVPDFGAIQVGKHRFCHPENGVMDCGTFDFLHIWRQQEDSWTLVRVVSYGH